MSSSRKISIDITRGLGIISVSIYHLVYRKENSVADKIICESIWLFLPLFFVTAGLTFNDRGTFRANLIHRFKALILPALKYSAIILILGGAYCAVFHGYDFRDWLRDLVYTYLRPEFSAFLFPEFGAGGILFENISPVWFVWALMASYTIFYLFVNFSLKSFVRLASSIFVLIIIGILLYDFGSKISWSLTISPIYAAMMLCGAWLSRHDVSIKFSGILPALVLHVLAFNLWGTDYIYANILGTIRRWSVIIFFAQIFIGGYFASAFSRACMKINSLAKILSFVGRNSFIFLMLHGIFGLLASDLLNTYIKLSPDNWYIENLTPEIFIKSLFVWMISLAGCSIFCVINNMRSKTNVE